MDTIQTLQQKINEKTKSAPIFYFARDIERGLGLENILDNYKIFCISDNGIVNYLNDKVFCLSREENNQTVRASSQLLKHPKIQEMLNAFPEKYIQTFKISPQFENELKKLGAATLNTTSQLNKMFEDKILQHKFFVENGIMGKRARVDILKNMNFTDLTKEFGL
ncbi:MAG: hypothetical protein KDC82_04745, partial [Bacteroidetes bacterium]|nr:hypothetical protein [Bacteroidota bacterium]